MGPRWQGQATSALVGGAVLLALIATAGSARQDDGLSPSALSCPLPPLSLPLFAATPASQVGTPLPPPDPSGGESPPSDVQEEIEASVEVIVDCTNTGEPRFVYAVFSERYLAALFVGETPAYQPAFERLLTEPPRPPTGPLVLRAVDELRLLPDGRAVVELTLESGGQSMKDTLILVKAGDYWLVDVVMGRPPEATAAARRS